MKASKEISIVKIIDGRPSIVNDVAVVEEPLEVRLTFGPMDDRHTRNVAITMRTPGEDEALALGFLFTEGIIHSGQDVVKVSKSTYQKGELNDNIVTIAMRPGITIDLDRLHRNFYTSSSCGICGKASIEAIQEFCYHKITVQQNQLHFNIVHELPDKLRSQQAVFTSTGGLHSAAIFDTKGKFLMASEDVGRHNAVDKLAGKLLIQNYKSVENNILMLSGRASFELLQKAAMVGFPIVCSIGAPSTLAIEAADSANITLIGFAKSNSFNIYTHKERIHF